MARYHYKEIADRFTHIDATFEGFELDHDTWTATYKVRFYPWWEHPLYIEAVQHGRPWGFSDAVRDATTLVTVTATNVAAIHLSHASDVIDWDFVEEHPLLVEYEPTRQVFCNGKLTRNQAHKLVSRLRDVAHGANIDIWDSTSLYQVAQHPPFGLGDYPLSLANTATEYLESEGVPIYVPESKAETQPSPKMLLIDGTDYIIADDFEVDFEEVEHRPEYFQPR